MPPPKLLLVLSEQRSGSSFFSDALASVLPCGVLMGEAMLPNAGGGGFDQRPFAAAMDTRLMYKRSSLALPWLLHVRSHACAERTCACIGVVKLFRTHPVFKIALRRLLGSPDVASVVLERDASGVECSLRWAQQTADFAATPNERRRVPGQSEARARFRSGCAPSPDFLVAHNAWYAQLRRLRPTLHVSFDEATQRTATALTRVASALHVPVSPWVATHANETRALPATLGVVTIVRRNVDRLAPWLAHHAFVGVDEVALYSTNDVHRAVAQLAAAHTIVTLHQPLHVATERFGQNPWSYAWRQCPDCCRSQNTPLVRDAALPGMCERRMFMPEQAHAVRHAVTRLKTTWLLHMDVDEYLATRGGAPHAWRSYLALLSARKRVPGGVHVPQLQMLGSLNATEHLTEQLYEWEESKCLVRRAALHEHPRAFGSIHHVTLKKGEFYMHAPSGVLALLHYRYLGWRTNWRAEVRARLRELGCGANSAHGEIALICRRKRQELAKWAAQRASRGRVNLDAARTPHCGAC